MSRSYRPLTHVEIAVHHLGRKTIHVPTSSEFQIDAVGPEFAYELGIEGDPDHEHRESASFEDLAEEHIWADSRLPCRVEIPGGNAEAA